MGKALTMPLVLADTPLENADLLYATGFMAPDPVVYIQGGRQRILVVSTLEWGRACRETAGRGIRVLTPEHLGLEGTRRREMSLWIKAALRPLGARRITVPSSFPYGLACRLKKAGVGVELLERDPFPTRRTKRPDEIACIRQVQRAAVIAMRTACAMIEQSRADGSGKLVAGVVPLTAEAVQRRISEVLLAQDCHGGETIVACGTQGADPHARGQGPLWERQPIILDIFPRHQRHGYWGDLSRTVVKGEPSRDLKRMYLAVRRAQAAALREVRAGAACLRVHKAAVEVFRRAGYETGRREEGFSGFIHNTGHGVGLAIHEAPSLGTVEGRLRAGDVITVEPGLYYPALGGVRIEDTVVVTRDGWKYLAPCERRFVLG